MHRKAKRGASVRRVARTRRVTSARSQASVSLLNRYRGCLLGLAIGDALGTSVEFSPPGSFPPVTDMRGGGPFELKPGEWTDDTAMALCLAESLLYRDEFDATDQMNRYVNWWQHGYMSATGECFDIGMTIRGALARYLASGDPFSGSTDPRSAGNGSLMRLAPVALFYFPDIEAMGNYAAASSRTTHAAEEAVECCRLFACVLHAILEGRPRDQLQVSMRGEFEAPAVLALAQQDYDAVSPGAIKGSGYCIESLRAALWSFLRTASFKDAVLTAVNLGDDADTTGAIAGQLAGAYYGASAIPRHWIRHLAMREHIDLTARRLYARSKTRQKAKSDMTRRSGVAYDTKHSDH